MVELTKLNNDKIYMNTMWIETVEAVPDTTITLRSGNKIIVLEPIGLVIDKIIEWHLQLNKLNKGGVSLSGGD